MKRPQSSAASACAWVDADTGQDLSFAQLARTTTAMEAYEPSNPVDGPSAPRRFVPVRQPAWASEAERGLRTMGRLTAWSQLRSGDLLRHARGARSRNLLFLLEPLAREL